MNAAPSPHTADAALALRDAAGATAPTSSHTGNVPDLLRQLEGCLPASTCEAGKLVLLRPGAAAIETHFHAFNRPMAMAACADAPASGACRS